jgi:hypothetical protein
LAGERRHGISAMLLALLACCTVCAGGRASTYASLKAETEISRFAPLAKRAAAMPWTILHVATGERGNES